MNIIYKKNRSKGLIFLAIFFFIFIPIILVLSLVSKYNLSISQLILPILILIIIFLAFTILILKNNNDMTITADGTIHFKNNYIKLSDIKNIHPVLEYQYFVKINPGLKNIEYGNTTWKDRLTNFGTGISFPVYIILHDNSEYNLGYMSVDEIDTLDRVIVKNFGKYLVN